MNNQVKPKRHYYAGKSFMGVNFSYDCDCWKAYRFDSKKERDEWVAKNEYNQNTGNYVAEALSANVALRIAGLNSRHKRLLFNDIDNSIVACWA